MFAHVENPQTLSAVDLDLYLEKGWFRMGQTIFTTNFLNFKSDFFSAIWLRVALNEWNKDNAFTKLQKSNKAFKVNIEKATITPEKEMLYAKYKIGVGFDASSSLDNLLYGSASHSIYNTYEITLHDNEKLIAVGYFDLGDKSAAGITSFYDQHYKKFSLGRYLIYLKMDYCKKKGFDYFYPGYFVPGYKSFDYKLGIGTTALQFLQLTTEKWLPISDPSIHSIPLDNMINKLLRFQEQMEKLQINGKIMRYEFFGANLIPDLAGMELFDYPVFYQVQQDHQDVPYPLVVFDIFNNCYTIIRCVSLWKSNTTTDDSSLYVSHLLKPFMELFSSDSVEEAAQVLLGKLKEENPTISGKN